MPPARLDALYVHPLKGGRALPRAEALAERGGFAEDRRWMLVRQDGSPVMLKTHPALTTLSLDLDGLALVAADPDGEVIEVAPPAHGAARLPVRTKQGERPAQVADAAANRWFSERLGETVWVAHLPSDPETRGFAGKAAFLLASTASLAALNAELDAPVGMDRFRANLVVDGLPAWEEDRWRELRIGAARFRTAGPCPRCPNTTVDPATGAVGVEPLRTLQRIRLVEGKPCFGVYLETVEAAPVHVGDPVEVLG